MAVFAYKAAQGASVVNGTITADTPRQARDSLRDRGYTIERLTPQRTARPGVRLPRGGSLRIGRRFNTQLVSFTRELSTLLGVGIPLLEALDTINRQHRGPFGLALLQLRDCVAAGASLAEAMRQRPDVFDELSVSITEVGESSGTLDAVLERLAEFKERSLALKNRIATALIYPAIVAMMAVATSIFLMTFVVPQLLVGLIEAGRPLPLPTRVVKAVSDGLLSWWWLLLIVIAITVTGVVSLLRTPRGRVAWHRWQLRLPILGDMIRKQALVRIAVVMASLLKNGVIFVRALQIAQRSTPNLVLRSALHRCEIAVTGGRDISVALEDTGAFPPLVVQIFSVGQQSGRLEEMLERLARDYDHQLSLASQRFTAILEPLLILFLVFVVGFIAFATVLPILEAGNVL